MTALFKHAPVELACKMLSAVMEKDYSNALAFCQAILIFEPDNETYKNYEKVLSEAKNKEDESDEDNSSRDEGDNTEDAEGLESDESEDGDSGNSEMSSDDDLDENNNSSSEESSNETESDSDEISVEELSKLNLLMGGLKVK